MTCILVTGGTGVLGHQVVARLAASESAVRVLSRRDGGGDGDVRPGVSVMRGDLLTGSGVDAAVAGADAIVHCATTPDPRKPDVDVQGTARLVEAARQVGKPHLVYISIVGIEGVPMAYYRGKLEAEALVRESGLPWTILRATQFHDLLLRVLTPLAKLPVALVPRGFSFQPVDAGEVADRLAELALGEPAGRAPDFGGPEVRSAEELMRTYLRMTSRRRPVVRVPVLGAAARGVRSGALLAPGQTSGTVTFSEFLERTVRR